jgi:hypothetical protein
LKGIPPASASAPAIFAVAESTTPDCGFKLGPLAVDFAEVAAASLDEAGFFAGVDAFPLVVRLATISNSNQFIVEGPELDPGEVRA